MGKLRDRSSRNALGAFTVAGGVGERAGIFLNHSTDAFSHTIFLQQNKFLNGTRCCHKHWLMFRGHCQGRTLLKREMSAAMLVYHIHTTLWNAELDSGLTFLSQQMSQTVMFWLISAWLMYNRVSSHSLHTDLLCWCTPAERGIENLQLQQHSSQAEIMGRDFRDEGHDQ